MARSPAPKPTVASGPSKRQREIFALHGKNLDGSPVARQTSGGSGGKGGSKPSYDIKTMDGAKGLYEAQQKYNTDKSYGYYGDDGKYVSAFQDMTDGGGMNTTDTYFQGGPFSAYLNALKVRPAGMAREKVDGQYVVPREQIGFRDATDMGDGGGPQAMGGPKMGLPVSNIFNALDKIGGVDQGERVTYASMTPQELERRRAARGY